MIGSPLAIDSPAAGRRPLLPRPARGTPAGRKSTSPPLTEKDDVLCEQFKRSVLPHQAVLKRIALRRTLSEADADDLVQETFARAWKYRATIDWNQNIRCWLCSILRNEAVRIPKLMQRHTSLADSALALEEILPCLLQDEPDEAREFELVDAIKKLPPESASIVLLAAQGYSYREIARREAIPMGTVMSRLCRGRRAIRQILSGGVL